MIRVFRLSLLLGGIFLNSCEKRQETPVLHSSNFSIGSSDTSVRYTIWVNDEPALSGFRREELTLKPVKSGMNNVFVELDVPKERLMRADHRPIYYSYKVNGERLIGDNPMFEGRNQRFEYSFKVDQAKLVDGLSSLVDGDVEKAFERYMQSLTAKSPEEFLEFYYQVPQDSVHEKEIASIFKSNQKRKLRVSDWEVVMGDKYAIVRPINDGTQDDVERHLFKLTEVEGGWDVFMAQHVLISKDNDGRFIIWSRGDDYLKLK